MAIALQLPGLAFAALILAAATSASSADALVTFVFGDSLTEVGNNNYMQYSLAKSNYPWYGVDYAGGQATGRFTNGRTIGDIICTLFILNFYYYLCCVLINCFHG